MELFFKIMLTYAIVSFVSGVALMVFDSATDYRHHLVTAVSILYLPPLGLAGLFVVAFAVGAIWR